MPVLFVYFYTLNVCRRKSYIQTYIAKTFIIDAKKVLIILTDGRSSGSVDQPAQQLKNIGVVIFSIGVGSGVDVFELETIGSPPVDEHVYLLGSFDEFSTLAEKMSSSTCKRMP